MKGKSFTSLVLLTALIGGNNMATAADSDNDDSMYGWQLSLLFEPSPAQLKVEDRGRVVIYDSLRSSDIERAMDEQFDRVDNMMFVNTIITDTQGMPIMDPDTGVAMVEDDGCD